MRWPFWRICGKERPMFQWKPCQSRNAVFGIGSCSATFPHAKRPPIIRRTTDWRANIPTVSSKEKSRTVLEQKAHSKPPLHPISLFHVPPREPPPERPSTLVISGPLTKPNSSPSRRNDSSTNLSRRRNSPRTSVTSLKNITPRSGQTFGLKHMDTRKKSRTRAEHRKKLFVVLDGFRFRSR